MEKKQAVEEMIQQYMKAWNTQGMGVITQVLSTCWAEGGTYVDVVNPLTKGVDELAALINYSYEVMPGRAFICISKIEYKNGVGRFFWQRILPDEEVLYGMDYFEYTAAFKLTKIVGFFNAL